MELWIDAIPKVALFKLWHLKSHYGRFYYNVNYNVNYNVIYGVEYRL
jgi:hypothetical protein